MAVNIDTLKSPTGIIIIGAGLVAGIFFISKLKGKKAAEVPQEVGVSYAVQAVDNVEQQDSLTRSLTDAQEKYLQLEDKQRQAQQEYEEGLASRDARNQSERDTFNQRLIDERTRLGTQFDTQLASLRAQIDSLTKQKGVQDGSLNKPATAPVQGPVHTIAQPPTSPVAAGQRYYPGFGTVTGVYQMNCGGKPRDLIFSSFEAAVADQKNKGLSSTSLARNMVAIAVSGSTKWEVLWGDKLEVWLWQNWLNTTRVSWGLAPLAQFEMNALKTDMYSLWNGNERDPRFQSLSYASALWQKYNLPYQCGSSIARR